MTVKTEPIKSSDESSRQIREIARDKDTLLLVLKEKKIDCVTKVVINLSLHKFTKNILQTPVLSVFCAIYVFCCNILAFKFNNLSGHSKTKHNSNNFSC